MLSFLSFSGIRKEKKITILDPLGYQVTVLVLVGSTRETESPELTIGKDQCCYPNPGITASGLKVKIYIYIYKVTTNRLKIEF